MGVQDLEVSKLHTSLGSAFTRIAGASSLLVSVHGTGRWQNVPIGKTVQFQLQLRDPAQRDTALRERGGKVPVVPLPAPASMEVYDKGPLFWVSWFEEWRRERQHSWVLLTARWTLFRGMYLRQKMQILRVDWDQLVNQAGNEQAGQPHWHFDQSVRIDGRSALEPVEALMAQGAVTPVIPANRALKIGHVHLAMGTWQRGEPNPQCWQRNMANCEDLRQWAVCTLRYLLGQFPASWASR